MTRPATYDHLRSKKKPIEKTVEIVLDAELAERFEEARTQVDIAQIRVNGNPTDVDLQLALEQAKAAVETLRTEIDENDAVVKITFRGIGRKAYDDLVADHPATLEQLSDAKKKGHDDLQFNLETFPPAIVAASSKEPKMTLEEVQAIWNSEDWNQVELGELFTAAMMVNGTRRTVDLGKGSRTTGSSVTRSSTARNGGSRTASS
jgi:hypothetical protein